MAVSEGNMVQKGWGSEASPHWLGRHATIWQVPEKDRKGLRELLQHDSEPSFPFCFFFLIAILRWNFKKMYI